MSEVSTHFVSGWHGGSVAIVRRNASFSVFHSIPSVLEYSDVSVFVLEKWDSLNSVGTYLSAAASDEFHLQGVIKHPFSNNSWRSICSLVAPSTVSAPVRQSSTYMHFLTTAAARGCSATKSFAFWNNWHIGCKWGCGNSKSKPVHSVVNERLSLIAPPYKSVIVLIRWSQLNCPVHLTNIRGECNSV